MSRGTEIILNSLALRNNFARVRELAPNSKILSVVKADAYGHGSQWAAKHLAETDGFGVANIEEAQELRDAGMTQPILLLEGVFDLEELKLAEQLRCDLVVHQSQQIELLEAMPASEPFVVWLKVNTGMNRLGFALPEVDPSWQRLEKLSNVKTLRLMTHFACADREEAPLNVKQWQLFKPLLDKYPVIASAANSAATVHFPHAHLDWVRPGIMLYGASPVENQTAQELGLQAVMSFRARVIALQSVAAGESVGYVARWTATKDSLIAVVSVGYGDGYPCHAPEGTPVMIGSERVPLVGRVSMDMITVDVSALKEVSIGAEVELWGEQLPVDEVAAASGTISYELLCKVTSRVKRTYL